ncbi:MAG: ComF family protein [Burkholderiaceae bacterium]
MPVSLLSLWHAWSARWPGLCQVCARWPSEPVCQACVQRFCLPQPRCQGCARLTGVHQPWCDECLADQTPRGLTHCAVAVDYAYPWNQLVARLKFRGEPAWAHSMARLLLDQPEVRTLLAEADLIVPVPLTTRRLAERGYNQAWQIARSLRRLGRQRGLAVPRPAAQALVRHGSTPDQHTLSREERWQNLCDAFQVHPVHGRDVHGQRIVLVDDVITTGATLQMAALALRKAGALDVDGVVFARTADPGSTVAPLQQTPDRTPRHLRDMVHEAPETPKR